MNALQQFLQAASNEAAGAVSGPVDLIGMGLRKLGVPVPRNALMSSEWMKQNGLMQDVPQSGVSLAGQTFGLLSPVAAAAKAPQIARGLLQMGDNAAAPRRLNPQTGAIAWQGSPHKFDQFDSSKIGTGEGAQAYGHGLYLAESERVGKSYMESLAGAADGPAGQTAASMLRMYKDPEAAANAIRSSMEPGLTAEAKKHAEDAISLLMSGKANTGYLYKVDLPDEKIARMLDWDKPLSQQAPEVQRLLGFEPGTRAGLDAEAEKLLSKYGPPGKRTKAQQDAFMREYNALNDRLDRLAPNLLGSHYYKGTDPDNFLHADLNPQSMAATSEELRKRGIPGIRYLDGGSRSAGAGSSNFVVFPGEENALRILERNGKPIR